MTARRAILILILLAVFGITGRSALPVAASHPRDVAPTAIDPATLALPASILPAGAVIDYNGVSSNDDADGKITPPGGIAAQLRIIHIHPYEQLGRITGYREDFHFTVQGAAAGTEYLASIYHSATEAANAMADAIGPGTLITLIGQPLSQGCSVGDQCAAYYGPNPSNPGADAVLAIYRRGPIVVETATQFPDAQLKSLEGALETQLYALLATADTRVQAALAGGLPPAPKQATNTPTPMPTATDTPAPTATNTPAPAPVKKPACGAHASRKHGSCTCKKGYHKKHGKCVKVKKKTAPLSDGLLPRDLRIS